MTSSEEKARAPTPEETAKLHKESFRCAFEFLVSHWPPVFDADWWDKTADDMVHSVDTIHGTHLLAEHLLMGVYGYLEDECYGRRKQDG